MLTVKFVDPRNQTTQIMEAAKVVHGLHPGGVHHDGELQVTLYDKDNNVIDIIEVGGNAVWHMAYVENAAGKTTDVIGVRL